MKRKTADVARGKWAGILKALGVDAKYLTGKHGPCPMCEGVDRFRFDNKEGNGTFICNQCGAGNGFDLLMQVHGWDFHTAASKVDEIVGNVEAQPIKQGIDETARKQMLNRLWADSRRLQHGDPAMTYLASRCALPRELPPALRFSPACFAPDGVNRPALLALVQNADDTAANIHRTFLGPTGKADMPNPRAMCPGAIPDGSAVRLFPVSGERLGIAEGIETAFAAAERFGVPVWSAINTTMLAKWQPPATVKEVWIFGDCDQKYGGQAAAYTLAAKLAGPYKLAVRVMIPEQFGTDWADVA